MNKRDIIFGLLAALFLAIILSPFASPWPDGLEKVAGDKGFLEKGEVEPIIHSPVPDYAWPGVCSSRITTSVAGMAGTIFVFACAFGVGYLLKTRQKSR